MQNITKNFIIKQQISYKKSHRSKEQKKHNKKLNVASTGRRWLFSLTTRWIRVFIEQWKCTMQENKRRDGTGGGVFQHHWQWKSIQDPPCPSAPSLLRAGSAVASSWWNLWILSLIREGWKTTLALGDPRSFFLIKLSMRAIKSVLDLYLWMWSMSLLWPSSMEIRE